ncbi:MAG: glyoxylate/hydroxypyruvate reductase A [Gammaproteobacteria bacterium]|nr:glyoxylate/hydroxypyruvate reductase A [Gammaproteobacteria bacterium]
MSITIISTRSPEVWQRTLNEVDPDVEIEIWPNEKDKSKIEMALCWQHPEGSLQEYPNLKAVSSLGAGVDHFLKEKDFLKDIPVLRVVDPLLEQSMFEYVCTAALQIYREFDVYEKLQQDSNWQPQKPRKIGDMTVGMMGVGKLGGYCGSRLAQLGFNVIGWSQTPKQIDSIKNFTGEAELEQFLAKTDILICLLPLTDNTRGLINKTTLNQLKEGASLINVARGAHVVEQDLIDVLDQGHLNLAFLDVFNQEPLPAEHPFWQHPKIKITPHCSSVSNPKSVAPQLIENYHRMKQGKNLLNQADLARGY